MFKVYLISKNSNDLLSDYVSHFEFFDKLIIIKDEKTIELTGKEIVKLYNTIKPINAPKIESD